MRGVVLGHAHLTLLLIPELIAGAKANTDGKARVINTSSSAVYYANTIDFELLTDTEERKKTYSGTLYCVSKLVSNTLTVICTNTPII